MHFGMDSLESDPNNASEFEELELSKRIEKFMLEIKLLLNRLVSFDIEWPPNKQQRLRNCDHKFEYSKEVISLGLFYMEFIDAVREADGERILRCWRYMLVIFKVAGKYKYSIEASNLLAQYHFLFTE